MINVKIHQSQRPRRHACADHQFARRIVVQQAESAAKRHVENRFGRGRMEDAFIFAAAAHAANRREELKKTDLARGHVTNRGVDPLRRRRNANFVALDELPARHALIELRSDSGYALLASRPDERDQNQRCSCSNNGGRAPPRPAPQHRERANDRREQATVEQDGQEHRRGSLLKRRRAGAATFRRSRHHLQAFRTSLHRIAVRS